MSFFYAPSSGATSQVQYTSSSLTGWTAYNGNGSASISGGFKVALSAAQSASNLYPDTSHPRYYRNISSDISGYSNWDIWVRIVSASLHSDSRGGISLNNSSDDVNYGINVGFGSAGEMFSGPFSNTVIGTPTSDLSLNGTGWIGILNRGGSLSAVSGTGTASDIPTSYSSVNRTDSFGSTILTRLSLYCIKWAGADSECIFDNIIIIKRS